MWNWHRESEIHYIHEIGLGTKLFITFESKVFRHEERETQSFYADCFYIVSSQPNQCAAPVALKVVRPRPGLNVDAPVRTQELDSTGFSQIRKSSAHASGAWRHSHPLVHITIWNFYFDICEWRILPAHEWTPALMLHLTNPCTKRKVLILTKPRGKIYKTKYLRHYSTSFDWVRIIDGNTWTHSEWAYKCFILNRIRSRFSFFSRGIILWIELLWP